VYYYSSPDPCCLQNVEFIERVVRPKIKVEQNTLILRDIAEGTAVEDILKMFETAPADPASGQPCPQASSARADIGNTWFVIFASEQEARLALSCIRNSKLNDMPVRARLKTESLNKSYFSNADPRFRYPGMVPSPPGGPVSPDVFAMGVPAVPIPGPQGMYYPFAIPSPGGMYLPGQGFAPMSPMGMGMWPMPPAGMPGAPMSMGFQQRPQQNKGQQSGQGNRVGGNGNMNNNYRNQRGPSPRGVSGGYASRPQDVAQPGESLLSTGEIRTESSAPVVDAMVEGDRQQQQRGGANASRRQEGGANRRPQQTQQVATDGVGIIEPDGKERSRRQPQSVASSTQGNKPRREKPGNGDQSSSTQTQPRRTPKADDAAGTTGARPGRTSQSSKTPGGDPRGVNGDGKRKGGRSGSDKGEPRSAANFNLKDSDFPAWDDKAAGDKQPQSAHRGVGNQGSWAAALLGGSRSSVQNSETKKPAASKPSEPEPHSILMHEGEHPHHASQHISFVADESDHPNHIHRLPTPVPSAEEVIESWSGHSSLKSATLHVNDPDSDIERRKHIVPGLHLSNEIETFMFGSVEAPVGVGSTGLVAPKPVHGHASIADAPEPAPAAPAPGGKLSFKDALRTKK
jgi:hypothetical protein